MKIFSRVLVIFLALALALAPSAVRAEPALQTIVQRKVLKVGMAPGLAPFIAVGAEADELARRLHDAAPPRHATDGRRVYGFDLELADEIARALGVTLEVTLVDRFDALLPGLRDGRYDLALSAVTRTLDRAVTVAFSDPYFASGLQVLVRDGARFPLLERLRRPEVKVAFVAGTTAATFAARELKGATLLPVATDGALFAALQDARACDAVVIDYVTARDAEVRGRIKAALIPVEDRRFTTEHFAFATRQGDPDWVAWLNLFLKEAKGSGAFHRLAARYNDWFRSER